ncbi:hypothetical protein JTB14_019747 [Gonioctena quinquepunctata]|nr:hypothetical protein JTB14_019747 [Gonioctena quinquepunctata]
MSEDCTWSVVQFTNDHTVEAVPTAWIQGDRCHWPSFPPDKMINAIRKFEPLIKCWDSHPIKIFRNATFNEYIKARNKAKVAEDTSDLASEAEIEAKRKRKMKKVFSSSSEDDSMEMNIPTPPTLKISNWSFIKKTSSIESIEDREQFMKDNQDVFEGLGSFPEECNISLKKGSVPIARPCRRVPSVINERLQAKLEA